MLIQLGGGENLRGIKGMGWTNLDEKELNWKQIWNGVNFYGDREFDVAGFGGAKKVSLYSEF